MPSFRARFAVQGMKSGHQPAEVLPAAWLAIPDHAHADDVRLDIEKMRPLVTVRFAIPSSNDDDEDARAWECARQICANMQSLATMSPPVVLRRTGQTWTPLELPE